MMRVKTAFTLAEVLVTLMIIGVIAAMTIPGLRKNADMQEYVAGCKKAHTTISNAMRAAEMEHGDFKRWGFKDGDDDSIQKVGDYLTANMNILRKCEPNKPGCWTQTRKLNGTGNIGTETGIGENSLSFTTADGMNWSLDGGGASVSGVTNNIGTHFRAFVDINGDKKPNMMGYDVFVFIVDANRGVVPAGADNNSANCSQTSTNNYAGVDCAAKVIKEGKITY